MEQSEDICPNGTDGQLLSLKIRKNIATIPIFIVPNLGPRLGTLEKPTNAYARFNYTFFLTITDLPSRQREKFSVHNEVSSSKKYALLSGLLTMPFMPEEKTFFETSSTL